MPIYVWRGMNFCSHHIDLFRKRDLITPHLTDGYPKCSITDCKSFATEIVEGNVYCEDCAFDAKFLIAQRKARKAEDADAPVTVTAATATDCARIELRTWTSVSGVVLSKLQLAISELLKVFEAMNEELVRLKAKVKVKVKEEAERKKGEGEQ